MRDYISRQAVIDLMMQKWGENFSGDDAMQESIDAIRVMPSVTPQEPQSFKWCTDCKEYDQEKHCCHRWSKVIRDTVEEMKQEQEPFKPMVEIDLYSVIKQKYIEREVLDRIRSEIGNALSDGMIHKKTVLGIIDKYKAETEG